MPRSTYAYDVRAISRDTARAELVASNARRAFEESGRVYGYRRVRAAMAAWDEPFAASEREVRRAMREGGMSPRRTRRRRAWSSYAGEFERRLNAYLEWYRDGRLKAFREGGKTVYETIAGRRRRLGYEV